MFYYIHDCISILISPYIIKVFVLKYQIDPHYVLKSVSKHIMQIQTNVSILEVGTKFLFQNTKLIHNMY